MRKLVFVLLAARILVSCSNNDDSNSKESDLIGEWKLIEVYYDSGGGNGTFNSVESEKTISFSNDGVVTSNGDLCSMSADTGNSSNGTYSQTDSTILPENCQDAISNWSYSFVREENILIIDYPCIEPCKAKFLKQ